MEQDVSPIFEGEIRDQAWRYHLEFLGPKKKKKIKQMSSEGDEEKERATNTDCGKEE